MFVSFISFVFLVLSCFHYEESEKSGFTADAQIFVDKLLKENNTTKYVIDIVDVSISGGFANPIGYHLGLIVDSCVVLTNTIDSLNSYGIYRFEKSEYGNGGGLKDLPFMGISVKCDTLDSISVVTDSFIKLQDLGLGFTNLTHLPAKINKLRVKTIDIGYNYKTLQGLPDELMQLSEPPKYWDTLIVNYDMGAVNQMTTVSDTLKKWLLLHAAQK
jgi:hypothetical protein